MLLKHAEDLSSFLKELQSETDRGLPLVGASLIDEKLLRTLESFLINCKAQKKLLKEPNAPLGTFSSRADICYALGLIDSFEYQEIGIIRKIRNVFAHTRHGITFSDKKIIGLCTSLKSPLPDGENISKISPRFRLINSVLCIVLRLYYRPEWVEKERLKEKKWVPDSCWYNMNDKKPPENAGFIGLVSQEKK
jgi:hypothetical protein